jgi:hypothetical protein
MHVGTHLGVNFKNAVLADDDSTKVTIVERYWASEISPNYFLSKNVSVGIYYLYSHGLDPTTVKNSHFITVNAGFSNIKLTDKFFVGITPQFYYLKQGERDGFYFTSAFTLARSGLPLSIASVINKEIETDILGSKDFVWNVTLTYTFGSNIDYR